MIADIEVEPGLRGHNRLHCPGCDIGHLQRRPGRRVPRIHHLNRIAGREKAIVGAQAVRDTVPVFVERVVLDLNRAGFGHLKAEPTFLVFVRILTAIDQNILRRADMRLLRELNGHTAGVQIERRVIANHIELVPRSIGVQLPARHVRAAMDMPVLRGPIRQPGIFGLGPLLEVPQTHQVLRERIIRKVCHALLLSGPHNRIPRHALGLRLMPFADSACGLGQPGEHGLIPKRPAGQRRADRCDLDRRCDVRHALNSFIRPADAYRGAGASQR